MDMCEEAGIAFLGPKSDTMRLFSRKHDARAFAENAKVPILAGDLDHSTPVTPSPGCSAHMLCLETPFNVGAPSMQAALV